MNTLTKALVLVEDNTLKISLLKMSIYVPINRYIDEAGFYAFDVISSPHQKYLITFLEEEKNTPKTKFLLTKIGTHTPYASITADDLDEIKALSYPLTGLSPTPIQ